MRNIAISRRNNTCRNRARIAKGVTNRHDPFTDFSFVRVTKFHEGHRFASLNFQQRNIRGRVTAQELRLISIPIWKGHFNKISPFNNVIIGDDIAIRIHHKAWTERFWHTAILWSTAAKEIIKTLQRRTLWEGRRIFGIHFNGLRCGDIDHGRRETFSQLRKTIRHRPSLSIIRCSCKYQRWGNEQRKTETFNHLSTLALCNDLPRRTISTSDEFSVIQLILRLFRW